MLPSSPGRRISLSLLPGTGSDPTVCSSLHISLRALSPEGLGQHGATRTPPNSRYPGKQPYPTETAASSTSPGQDLPDSFRQLLVSCFPNSNKNTGNNKLLGSGEPADAQPTCSRVLQGQNNERGNTAPARDRGEESREGKRLPQQMEMPSCAP